MGERKARTLSKSHSAHARKMTAPGASNLTALLQSASTGSATFVRCPSATLGQLRGLNEAEWITLFTPFVPHPPSTVLARNMDPFEPLGRLLPRQVRHIPYRMDHGMTDTHVDFLHSSGAILVVVCSTENVLSHDPKAFEEQRQFAQDISRKASQDKSLANVPVIILLITNGSGRQAHEEGLKDAPALVTCNNYTTAALANAVKVMFGN
ncbi:hypothetical protein EJ04DRAFT_142200 [Polyplosphaeria fusca]|uniref:Uncharacterized protein n=1 Tax=Polyplosphaeria fusca TaxID=682080 RepID=A0A9P4R5F7_9PLEO|nr:hypothetical protein EJ04DRAFT_142200 [Polyplosphaeria fusca]